METKQINGTHVTINSEGHSIMLAKKIGSEFIFLAQFNKTEHLNPDALDAVKKKMRDLISHQHEERRKHERKITIDGHFKSITNNFLKFLEQEMNFKNKEHLKLIDNTVFCIIQAKTNYGQGIIFKNGYILNNTEVFEVSDKEEPSYLSYLKNPQNKHWCKSGDNLFFLRDIETTTLSEQKISQKDITKFIEEGASSNLPAFICLTL